MQKLIPKLFPSTNSRQEGKRAFTLIELIMAIVIVGILAIPLSITITEYIQAAFLSQDNTMGLNLARLEMEEVNSMDYDDIVSAILPNYKGYPYDLTRIVTFAQGGALAIESLKQIRVDVRRQGDLTVLLSLITYIAKNVSYGI